VQSVPCTLASVVDEVKPVAEAYPRRSGVALVWPADVGEMPEVMADPGRLRRDRALLGAERFAEGLLHRLMGSAWGQGAGSAHGHPFKRWGW
ncbi:MAG TPA: hypothetical protein VFF77_01760, partial [Holophagaceae bacterium]|nr:hypothetical protein [Holophagaceae bacterium]